MSRKDYEAIAGTLANENPLFDRERFLKACRGAVMSGYNGWKNRQTWNCAPWIGNDEGLYNSACEFMSRYKGRAPYAAFIRSMGMDCERTGDNIAWISSRISFRELNAMMRELVS